MNNQITRTFETLSDFLDYVIVPAPASVEGTSRDEGDFYGPTGFDETVKLARTGWREGAEQSQAIRALVDEVVADTTRVRSTSYGYDVNGEFLDVGRYLSGEPECFGLTVPSGESTSSPVVKIVVNLAASAAISTRSIFARGAAVLAAIDILEGSGRRVEVWVAKGGYVRGRHKKYIDIRVCVKRADHPLDSDRLAFLLCHASCLRRLFFAAQERCGYSATKTNPHAVTDPDAIVTDHAVAGEDFSPEGLINYIDAICRQAGVTICRDSCKS